MARTLNGEVLIDDNGNLNEGLWLGNLLACAELLKDRAEPQESKESDAENLCDSCKTKGCIFQSGIVRSHCDFYKGESEG